MVPQLKARSHCFSRPVLVPTHESNAHTNSQENILDASFGLIVQRFTVIVGVTN